MTNEFPTNDEAGQPTRLDALPETLERTGIHRAPSGRRRIVTFAWAALATGILVAVGTMGLFAYNGKLDIIHWLFPNTSPTDGPNPTVLPTVDPKLTISVLNGTAREGLATEVGDKLVAGGWTVAARSNSSETDVKKTMVFYAVKTFAGAALGVCQTLGDPCEVKFTSAFGNSASPLTLVVGNNFPAGTIVNSTPTPTPSQ